MNRKRMMIIGAILLIVGGTAAYGIWQVERPGGLVWQYGFKYKRLGEISQSDFSSQLPADSTTIKNLMITVRNEDVTITKGTRFRVATTKFGSKGSDKALSVTFKDGSLSIEENRDHESPVFFGINNFTHKIHIEIPEDSHLASIEVKNKNGDLNVNHLKQLDSLLASSDNGDVTLENIMAKFVRVSSQNGDLAVKHVNLDSVSAKNQNGDISFKSSNILNRGGISNENGDIDLEKTEIPDFYAVTIFGDKEIKRRQVGKEISRETAKLRVLNRNGDIEID